MHFIHTTVCMFSFLRKLEFWEGRIGTVGKISLEVILPLSLLSTIRLLCKFPFLNDDNEGNDDILIENSKNIVITMLESLNEVISFSMNVSAPQLFLTIVFFYNNRDDKH